MIRWQDVTALFGGRFDPPHLGHREAVKGLFASPGVKQVIVIPSASPPHKPTFASAEDRAQMAQLNFQTSGFDRIPGEVILDRRELDRAKQNPLQPSYSFDTIQEMRQISPKLAFVIGADQFEQLPTWHRFPELLGLCHWIVLERKPHGSETARRTLAEWKASGLVAQTNSTDTWQVQKSTSCIALFPTSAPEMSSTQIRKSISLTGTPLLNTLSQDVLGYLKDRQLYGI